VKRLVLAVLVAGAALAGTAPAHATILSCDNTPVGVNCYSSKYHRWCTIWVAGQCDLPPLD
jgi:hypothetical protein